MSSQCYFCHIDLNSVPVNETIVLPCRHAFDKTCWDKHVPKNQLICPICVMENDDYYHDSGEDDDPEVGTSNTDDEEGDEDTD